MRGGISVINERAYIYKDFLLHSQQEHTYTRIHVSASSPEAQASAASQAARA